MDKAGQKVFSLRNRISSLLIVISGLALPFGGFAASPSAVYATKDELNTAINNEISNRNSAIGTAITQEASDREAAIAKETRARQDADSTLQNNINTLQTQINSVPVYHIGDTGPGNGIVFWTSNDGQHGLESAPEDQALHINWGGSGTTINASRDGANAGIFNTERIISVLGAGSYAAKLCENYHGGNYGDWYLPSLKELRWMFDANSYVHLRGDDTWGNWYWSSTERDANTAWGISLINPANWLPKTSDIGGVSVRCIRAF